MTDRSPTLPSRGRTTSRKNHALRRWLQRATTRADGDGTEQWWREFDTLLRRARTRLRPLDP